MPTNLTGSTIADTFDQLLHVSDGPEATEKVVYSGTGVATALKLGTQSASVDNIKIDGNTISSTDTDGDINITPNGTGSVNITNIVLAAGDITADNIKIDGNTISSINTNGNINLTPNGTGSVVVSKIDVTAGAVPFDVLTNRAYAQFWSTQDQTTTANTATAVTFNNSSTFNTGITVVSNSRLTCAVAGVYRVITSFQFVNTDVADQDVSFWFRLNGTDIDSSASRVTVPKTGDGGAMLAAVEIFEQLTAGQYIEIMWAAESATVSLDYSAAQSSPFVRPAIPSVIVNIDRTA